MGRRAYLSAVVTGFLFAWSALAPAQTCQECFAEMAAATGGVEGVRESASVCFEALETPQMAGTRAAGPVAFSSPQGRPSEADSRAADYERLARLGILNLIQSTLKLGAPGSYPTRTLRAPDEAKPDERVQLYRSRFIALMAGHEVPLQFFAMQEAAIWRATTLVTQLEEKLREEEIKKIRSDATYKPNAVRLLINLVSRVVETKDLQGITDFMHKFYDGAESIVSLSNQIDELKWKMAIVLAENMTTASQQPAPATADAGTGTGTPGIPTAGRNAFLSLFAFGGAADFLGCDGEGKLLVSLAVPDEVILDECTLRNFDRMTRPESTTLKTPQLKERLTMILQLLRAKQLELIDAYVRYFEHYPVAMILTKLLKNLACSDNVAYVESYSIMREIVDLSLTRHPYVRAMIESGYNEGDRFYHPYLCVKMEMPVPPSQMEDPIIASQILHPRILRRLYDESTRYGADAALRVLNPRAADRIAADVEAVARQIFTGVTGRAANVVGAAVRASAPEPLYENLIGPALTPVLDRVRLATQPDAAPAATPAAGAPAAPEPARPATPPSLSIPELLARIRDYLGPDSVSINWEKFPVPTEATAPTGQGTGTPAPADAPPAAPGAAANRDYSQAYAWVNRVFSVLNRRAQAIMEMDRQRELALFDERYRRTPLPADLPKQDDVVKARHGLTQALLDVVHAIEAGIQASFAAKSIVATADQIEDLALDIVLFYLKKHTSVARFVNNTAIASTTGTRAGVGNDPTMRELWLKLFVRSANTIFRVNNRLDPAAAVPQRLGTDARTFAQRAWSIAGYCLGTLAVGGITSLMWVQGCIPPRGPATPPNPASPPPITAPQSPGR